MTASTLQMAFGTAGNAADYEASGWGRPEQDCTWTIAARAELRLPRPVAIDHALHLSYRAFLPELRPWQRVRVRLGKEIIGRFVARSDGEITLWLSQNALKSAEDPMLVSFDLVDAAKPPGALPRDKTVLAIGLRHASLEPLTPPISRDVELAARSCESLGRNCEFGLVQRYCQTEPISLLRWSGAPLEGLINGLNNDFAGLMETATGEGSPRILPKERQKFWWLTCDRYNIQVHTGESFQRCSVEQAAQNVRRRLRWLAGKLMDDIRSGEKVFIYSSAEITDVGQASVLIEAFRRCGGPGPLVIVGQGGQDALRQAGDNVWFARIPRLTSPGNATGVDLGAWLPVLASISPIAATLKQGDVALAAGANAA